MPEKYGFDAATLAKLKQHARHGDLGKLHSILVVKEGALVVEAYFNGAGRDDCQLIASVTKSIVSLLVGMSLERSRGHTVDTPLVDFFPQHADALKRDGKAAITLAHALTMTAGLDWDEYTYPHPDSRNPNTQMYAEADPKAFVLGRKRIHPPGETWAYNSGLSVLLGAAVRSMTGRRIDRFAEASLFAPLGINRSYWFRFADGTVRSNGDLLMTPRDLARIGLLVLNQGEWQGRQIVPRRWIAESTRRHTTTKDGSEYGYQWWLGSLVKGERRFGIVYGSGTGGQRLFIVPDLNMVVVITAQVFGNKGGPASAARILADFVIPAALPRQPRAIVAQPSEAFLNATVGTYRDTKSTHTIRVVREKRKLFMEPDPVPSLGPVPVRIELTPSAPARFHGSWNRTGSAVVDFDSDATGAIIGLSVNFLLRDRSYRKID